ncbi:hypothetical protein C1T31_09260 [Hanstruepera neustonica]|uniref:Sperm nuclear basic protein PL-I n=1 Tax=Hanstruepera neustonica TaxID=1445657 RepID=A0A2K1DXX3_9FLAO|nr:hypothetical protein [Hanstruepera neustonica]PNQ72886.1 hypothetical protein C1T31_09260 [Hanstruepera neustonica]
MKKIIYLLTALLVTSTGVNAATTTKADTSLENTTYRGYGENFIFVEGGIEFSVFPDGQFDFYMPHYGPNVNVAINSPGVSISFNSGYNYNPYVQYDEFGAIIQIEHVPVFYDFYGRVIQVGDIFINYNSLGYISRVGGLYVHYNRFNRFSYCTGFINPFNRVYVFRPWHTYYRIPAINHCVVYNRPYRQYYTPVRYAYTTPYRNNYRRTTAVASRRGNTVYRSRDLATVRRGDGRRNDAIVNTARSARREMSTNSDRATRNNRSAMSQGSERNNQVKSTASTPRNRGTVNSMGKPNRNSEQVKPRTTKPTQKAQVRNSRSNPVRYSGTNRNATGKTATYRKNNTFGKPKATNSRISNKGNKTTTRGANSRSQSGRGR